MSSIKNSVCVYCSKEFKYGLNSNGIYCSNKCSGTHRSLIHRQNWLEGKLSVIERSTIRRYLSELIGYKCSECNITNWNNKPITLQVDHIDGNAGNNNVANVRLLCPNCHSQQDTFGARNKGNGRRSRGLKLR